MNKSIEFTSLLFAPLLYTLFYSLTFSLSFTTQRTVLNAQERHILHWLDRDRQIKLVYSAGKGIEWRDNQRRHYASTPRLTSISNNKMYNGLPIMTNKMTLVEMQGVTHHLIDFIPNNEEYVIGDFQRDAMNAVCFDYESDTKIDDIHARGKTPIVVGGTHYYVDSLIFNNTIITAPPVAIPIDKDMDLRLNTLFDAYKSFNESDNVMPNEFKVELHSMLKEVDTGVLWGIHSYKRDGKQMASEQ